MKKMKLDEGQSNKKTHQNITHISKLPDKPKSENEEKYQTILENIQEGYFEVDLAGNFTFFSDSVCKIHGYPREELMGMNYRKYTDKETAKKLYQAFNNVYKTEEPLKIFDWQIIRKDGTRRFIEASVFLIKDLSDKATGFRTVISDVTERKKIEEKLRKEEQRFRILTEQSSDIIVLVNKEGKLVYKNKAVENILGYKIGERIGGSIYENLHPDDLSIVSNAFNKLINDSNCPVQKDEARLRDIHGEWHTFEIVASNLVEGNAIEMIIANLRDISERKKAEKKLQENEANYRQLFDNSPAAIYQIDYKNGKFLKANDVFCEYVGCGQEEITSLNAYDMLTEESKKLFLERLEKISQGIKVSETIEFEVLNKKGKRFYLQLHIKNIYDTEGHVVAADVVAHDITERKKAESQRDAAIEALRKSEKYFKEITENSSDILIIMDNKGYIKYCSRSVERFVGYKPEEVIGKNVINYVHPDDVGRAADDYSKAVLADDNTLIPNAFRVVHKDGREFYLDGIGRNLLNNPDVEGFVMNVRDISERKQMENALQESERNFRHSLDESPLGVCISTIEGETIYANKAILDIYGYNSIEELNKVSVEERYTPESCAEWQARKKKRIAGEFGPSEYDISIVRRDGEIRHLHVFRKEIFWNGKKRSQVIYQDITEHRKAEEAVLKEYNFSRSALDGLIVPFFMFDAEKRNFFRWNRTFSAVCGYSDEEIARMRPLDFVPESEKNRLLSLAEEFYATGHISFEMPSLSKSGTTTPYLFTGNFLTYDGKPYVLGMGIDISELKKVEKDLRKSEERYRSVFENAGLPLVIMEDSMRIFMVNDRFVEMFGYGKDEIESKIKFTDFIASGDRNALMQCFARRKGDKPVEYECLIAHRNGQKYDVLIRIGHIIEAGQFIASFTDITSRKQAEVALLESREHLQRENIRLRSSIRERYRFCDIIGKSRVMQDVYEFILKAAVTPVNIIIYGESGTGKELVAKAIHETSDRSRKNFITVNCGAIPETLMESEFFGYKKGSFTGANLDKPGYLDEADGGTLFLDEVGEIGVNMQVKLLRAISGDGFTPVGSSTIKKTDVRIIAATNRNLRDLVKRGVMREDFFYRIHILPIYIPPLRERKEDIPIIVDYFIQLHDNNPPPLPGHVIEALLNYDWPGNVRELQNVLHRYITLKRLDFGGLLSTKQIQTEEGMLENKNSFIKDFSSNVSTDDQGQKEQDDDGIHVEKFPRTLEAIERDHIMKTLSEHKWHRGRTASALGINRKTLFLKMQKFGLTQQQS